MSDIEFDLTVASNAVNKCNPAQIRWQTKFNWTDQNLFDHLTRGYPMSVSVYTPTGSPKRRKPNFLRSQLIGLDFDYLTRSQAVELINDPFVVQYGSFTYSTPSHTPDSPRLRIGYVLDTILDSVKKYEAVVRVVHNHISEFNPDNACTDASRFFYGNSQTDPEFTRYIGAVLPLQVVRDIAIQQRQVTKQEKKQSQDLLPIQFIEAITQSLRFKGENRNGFQRCHCPIHPPDEEPSAMWHPEKKILYCFHESRGYLAKEVGQALGIQLSDYRQLSTDKIDLDRLPNDDNSEKLIIDVGDFVVEIDSEQVVQYVLKNEYGDAELLLFLTQGTIIFDESEKCWNLWDGNRWRRDTNQSIARLLYDPLSETYARVAGQYTVLLIKLEAQEGVDEVLLARIRKIKKEVERRPKALRTYSRAQNVLKIASQLHSMKGTEWDQNPMLLGVRNGVIDLITGELRQATMEDFMRKMTTVEYDPNATAPRWQAFIAEIFDDSDTALFIQRLLGYCITGKTTDHVLPVFYGRGRNGKDTFIEALAYVMGDYASAGTEELLIQQSNFHGQAQPHIYNLMGKRLVWVTETREGSQLNVNQVKYLTGAGRLTARALYQNPVEFDATHHIILFTNHKPHVPSESEDYAIWKRLLLIPLTLAFVENPTLPNERQRDPELKQKLQSEAKGILRWLIDGCLAWQEQGLNPPMSILSATREYAKSEDVIGVFLDECCEISPYVEVRAKIVFDAYNQWAEDNGYPQLSSRKLGDRFGTQFEKKRSAQGNIYIGLRLTPDVV